MKEKQILVIIKEPGKAPAVEPLFDNDLKAFQKAVGGYVFAQLRGGSDDIRCPD